MHTHIYKQADTHTHIHTPTHPPTHIHTYTHLPLSYSQTQVQFICVQKPLTAILSIPLNNK